MKGSGAPDVKRSPTKKNGAVFSCVAMVAVVVAAGVLANSSRNDQSLVTQTAGQPNGKDLSKMAPFSGQPGPDPVQTMAPLVTPGTSQAWFVTADAQLLNSGDAGRTWRTASVADGEPTIGVTFATADLGWVLTAKGLSSTIDGGRSWTAPVQQNGLAFAQRVDAANGWGIAGFNELVRTSDGGKTWTKVTTPGAVAGTCFTSPSEGFIATLRPQATVFRTTDAGVSWHESLRRPAAALAAALNCTRAAADVRLEYDHARDESASEETLATPQSTDNWQVYTSNYDPSARRRQSAKIGGKADPGTRHSRVEVTDGLLVSLHLPSAGTSMIVDFSTDHGRNVTRSATVTTTKAPGDVLSFGASFADSHHGMMVVSTGGENSLQVLRTADGGQTLTASEATF